MLPMNEKAVLLFFSWLLLLLLLRLRRCENIEKLAAIESAHQNLRSQRKFIESFWFIELLLPSAVCVVVRCVAHTRAHIVGVHSNSSAWKVINFNFNFIFLRLLFFPSFLVSSNRCQYYLFRHPWVPAYQGVITFFVIANFTLATFMDPGVIPKGKPVTMSMTTTTTMI